MARDVPTTKRREAEVMVSNLGNISCVGERDSGAKF